MLPLSIIIVGMNHLHYVKRLMQTLFIECRPKVEFEVIYVDNCSVDGTEEWIRNNFPQVKIIENKIPLGFGENNNKGVKFSSGEFVAIINPDIEIRDDSIDIILDYMKKHVQVGIVAPQLLNPDGSIQCSYRRFITIKSLFYRFLSNGKDSSNNEEVRKYLCKDMDCNKEQYIDWAIGAALFLKRDTFDMLGGFDTSYYLYMEDEDLCLRSWQNNKPVVYLPESKMIHNHLRASKKIGKKMFMHIKSMITFFRKHGLNVKRCSQME